MVGVQRSRSDREKLRVAILTGTSLAWNPRALKEAQSLAGADFEVTVYGASANRDQQRTDEELANERGFSFESVVPRTAVCELATVNLEAYPDANRM